jgi:hypothetical protein
MNYNFATYTHLKEDAFAIFAPHPLSKLFRGRSTDRDGICLKIQFVIKAFCLPLAKIRLSSA